jgi:5,10-methylenetetrahydromethanopterin reductase
MRLGCMIMPRDLAGTRAAAQAAEQANLSWIAFGDSPVVFGDSYLHQAEAARVTQDIHVGPMVSHVVVRHPVVVAGLLSTLQELSGGRAICVLGTGNSAARGIGLPPARLSQLRAAVAMMREHWAGRAAAFGDSVVPATGVARPTAPIFLAGDGPKIARLGGKIGDGFIFSGAIDDELIRRRQAAAADAPFWVAAAVSPATTITEVRDDLGSVLVAIGNRALRGDLTERGVPQHLHAEVRAMHDRYDYGQHGAHERPVNAAIISRELSEFLADRFCLWGDDIQLGSRLHALDAAGCAGVMFIVNRPDPVDTIVTLGQRIGRLRMTADAG